MSKQCCPYVKKKNRDGRGRQPPPGPVHWFRLPDDVGTGTPGRVLPSDWSANFSSHGKPPVLSLSHMSQN